jgi:hypothetical protein
MRRHTIILMGLLVCAVAYGAVYFASTASARSLADERTPELAWLKQEFNLPDGEFRRICDLHAAYLPHCRQMCAQIDENNARLKTLLRDSGGEVTPEIERVLADSGRLRAQCQTMMLKHFHEVSATMPPTEGRRYLAWVQEKAFGPMSAMHASGETSPKQSP